MGQVHLEKGEKQRGFPSGLETRRGFRRKLQGTGDGVDLSPRCHLAKAPLAKVQHETQNQIPISHRWGHRGSPEPCRLRGGKKGS